MSLSLELRGWEEFRRFLRDFPSRVKIAIEEASEEASKLIAQSAKRKAPVRTGKLRDSIRASSFMVEARVPYAAYVEFGTRKMEAQPFLRPAIEESIPKVRNIFRTKIEDMIRSRLR
ncbi:MAG: HK97 gp10 family phage protein [archaeon]|nr:HK97 gp10 family phage protein [archaeon]MCP8313194.1 HK97 gp10 family phage protein [archaeon]MCP8316072.1 HK97 gp10 family phage protein [archaeon]MCP8320230.1 HK97 gp10 family phage protein [archaeon]